jgi:hypothetical protein
VSFAAPKSGPSAAGQFTTFGAHLCSVERIEEWWQFAASEEWPARHDEDGHSKSLGNLCSAEPVRSASCPNSDINSPPEVAQNQTCDTAAGGLKPGPTPASLRDAWMKKYGLAFSHSGSGTAATVAGTCAELGPWRELRRTFSHPSSAEHAGFVRDSHTGSALRET